MNGYSITDRNQHLGWRHDLEERTFLHASATSMPSIQGFSAPEKFDPRGWLDIENQGAMGSCAGHACSTVGEMLNWIDTKGDEIQLSRMWAYLMGQRESEITGDQGATITGVIQSAKKNGLCLEETFPYPQRYSTDIPPGSEDEAREHKILNHTVLRGYDECFAYLLAGFGVIEIGIPWKASLAHNNDGVIQKSEGQIFGGHAVAICGWTERKDRLGRKYLILINSHGMEWGKNGTAEVSPHLFDEWGQDRYSEMIGVSDLEEYSPRDLSFVDSLTW